MQITFAARLKQLREAAGLSQAELANRAELNQFGIAKLEQGQREPALETLLALARALGVSLSVFDEVKVGADAQPATPGKRGRPAKKATESDLKSTIEETDKPKQTPKRKNG